MGLSLADWEALLDVQQAARRAVVAGKLHDAGARYVIALVADCCPCWTTSSTDWTAASVWVEFNPPSPRMQKTELSKIDRALCKYFSRLRSSEAITFDKLSKVGLHVRYERV